MTAARKITLVVAEDDDEDFMLTKKALEKAGLSAQLHRVRDGEELLAFLRTRSASGTGRRQDSVLILLDLRMPRMNGREALEQLKSDPVLRRIPVIVLTSSVTEEDVRGAYELGVASFMRKPVNFKDFIAAVEIFKRYWLETAELPRV